MELLRRWAVPVTVELMSLGLQYYIFCYARQTAWVRSDARHARAVRWLYYLATLYVVAAVPQFVAPWHTLFNPVAVAWMMAATFVWAVVLISAGSWVWMRRRTAALERKSDPGRRRFLQLAVPAIAATPSVIAGAGIIVARSRPVFREVNLRVRGLHPDLNGVRISQLSDIHYGPFFTQRDLEYAVAMANESRAHIAIVTGDLITRAGDDLEGCLRTLRALRGDAGVFGCMGNHERYAGAEDLTAQLGQRSGLRFLRNENTRLRFGQGVLNLAGVDYQDMLSEPLVGAGEMLASDALNVLLSHTPTAFDRAAELGFDLTLSGHTHGGQIVLPIGHESISWVRVLTPYVRGLFERDGKQLYVSCGLGTVAVPMRVGAPPEVTLVRLCSA